MVIHKFKELNNEISICIVGLVYVVLPLAVAFHVRWFWCGIINSVKWLILINSSSAKWNQKTILWGRVHSYKKKSRMVAVWIFSNYCIECAKLFISRAEIKTETPRIMQKVKINVKYLWSKRKCIKNATTPMNLKRESTIKMGFNHTPNSFIV